MAENKGLPEKLSTCLEGSADAEMIKKVFGQRGLGSLSEEMMRETAERCGAIEGDAEKIHKEVRHGRKD